MTVPLVQSITESALVLSSSLRRRGNFIYKSTPALHHRLSIDCIVVAGRPLTLLSLDPCPSRLSSVELMGLMLICLACCPLLLLAFLLAVVVIVIVISDVGGDR